MTCFIVVSCFLFPFDRYPYGVYNQDMICPASQICPPMPDHMKGVPYGLPLQSGSPQ